MAKVLEEIHDQAKSEKEMQREITELKQGMFEEVQALKEAVQKVLKEVQDFAELKQTLAEQGTIISRISDKFASA